MTCPVQLFASVSRSSLWRIFRARCLRLSDLRSRRPWYHRTAICQGPSPEAAQRRHHDWLTMQGVSPWGRSRCKEVA